MDTEYAKSQVIKAGKMLCEKGLIQRTWGNVSCRINNNFFAITPSGRDYLSLTPDDIVVVNIHLLSYEGDIKPSSEKGIHAACYKMRPDTNFVIHTHQTYASAAGISGCDINDISGEAAEIIGNDVPLASYGLPGTKKLREGVEDALLRSSSKAVLMHRHGALCMGCDLDDAFNVATELENICKAFIFNRYKELTGKTSECFGSLSEYVAQTRSKGNGGYTLPAYNSERKFGIIEMTPVNGGDTVQVNIDTGMPLDKSIVNPESAILHSMIYKKRKDVNAVIHSTEKTTVDISGIGVTVKPFLDDFAQIVGITLKNTRFDPSHPRYSAAKTVKKLRGRDAVLIENSGAICVGTSEDEASAVKLVTEKGCMAYTAADIFGREKESVSFAECVLMRVIYKTKYSKKVKTNTKKG